MRGLAVRFAWAFVVLPYAAACSTDDGTDTTEAHSTLSREKLMDPETCKECHPNHYREWASSMHAYALEDPVFQAMNARGQREANIGDFCVNCHAPLAVREGYAKDGKNLEDVPKALRGITCYFCHNVESVDGTHNNPLKLANDTTMRGGIRDAKRTSAHGVKYSKLHDNTQVAESSKLCGSCHDIVTPGGVHLERTYAEWKGSLFSHGAGAASCGSCHMDGREGIAADDPDVRVPARYVHSHLFPGVDTALTRFSDTDVQRKAVDCALSAAVRASICPSPDGSFRIALETNAGHRMPSGASQDRRMWLEFVAYDDKDQLLYQSGMFDERGPVEIPEGEPGHDPALWMMRDRIFDADGNETHMFWEAAKSEAYASGYLAETLPQPMQLGASHTVERVYRVSSLPARVRIQVHVQPMGRDVLDSLVQSKDLDASIADAMPALTLAGTVTEWKASDGFGKCITTAEQNALSCPDDYICLLYPDLPQCK